MCKNQNRSSPPLPMETGCPPSTGTSGLPSPSADPPPPTVVLFMLKDLPEHWIDWLMGEEATFSLRRQEGSMVASISTACYESEEKHVTGWTMMLSPGDLVIVDGCGDVGMGMDLGKGNPLIAPATGGRDTGGL